MARQQANLSILRILVQFAMEAILCCARSGISTRDATLYCTTFPCHNCAKHIVSSGIRRVLYVEPYPKSHAKDLHKDSIAFDVAEAKKVLFEPFIGISSRRYLDLFSLKLGWGWEIERSERETGNAVKFEHTKAKVRVPALATFYIDNEELAAGKVRDMLEAYANPQ